MPSKIRSFQARNYRCLRHVDVRFDESFQIFVGPNASGKSTLFDALKFLFDLIQNGLNSAVWGRGTNNFQDLVWNRPTENVGFELAMELELSNGSPFRYEVGVSETPIGPKLSFENGFIGHLSEPNFELISQRDTVRSNAESMIQAPVLFTEADLRPVFDSQLMSYRNHEKTDYNYQATFFADSKMHESGDLRQSVRLSHGSDTTIGMLRVVDSVPIWQWNDDDAGTKLKNPMGTIIDAIEELRKEFFQTVQLDSRLLKRAAPMNGGESWRLLPSGSNLAWVIKQFREDDNHQTRKLFSEWISHIQLELCDLVDIEVKYREDDRHAYLMVKYADGVQVPSWMISDGTLRFIALTLLAYLPIEHHPTVCFIEEPENGIHPMAIDSTYASLSSIYQSQVFVASHSPTILMSAAPKDVMCFVRNENGSTVIPGNSNPRLAGWQSSADHNLFWAEDILT